MIQAYMKYQFTHDMSLHEIPVYTWYEFTWIPVYTWYEFTWNNSLHMIRVYIKYQFTYTNWHSRHIYAKSQFKLNMSFTVFFCDGLRELMQFVFLLHVSDVQFCGQLWELMMFMFLCFRCAVLWLTVRADCAVTTTFTPRRSRFSAACARTEGLRRSTCCVTCEPSTRLRFPASTGTRSWALKGAGVGCVKLVMMAAITCHVSPSAAQVLLASSSKPS